MLTLALVLLSGPFDAPLPSGDCYTQPLELHFFDYVASGSTAERIAGHQCANLIGSAERFPQIRPMVVGTSRFGHFTLGGQRFGWGVNLLTAPGTGHGDPDMMYLSPAVDLPKSWQQAIDKATVPALVVGGGVVLTSVLVGLLNHHHR